MFGVALGCGYQDERNHIGLFSILDTVDDSMRSILLLSIYMWQWSFDGTFQFYTKQIKVNINKNVDDSHLFSFLCGCVSHGNSSGYYSENMDETPEDVLMELIARFGQTLMRARDEVAK